MSLYRRYKDGRTQRWFPESGTWADCAPDEPQTRQRRPNEGMMVLPAEALAGDQPIISVKDFLRGLGEG